MDRAGGDGVSGGRGGERLVEGDGEGDEDWLGGGGAAPSIGADGKVGLEVADVDEGVWFGHCLGFFWVVVHSECVVKFLR